MDEYLSGRTIADKFKATSQLSMSTLYAKNLIVQCDILFIIKGFIQHLDEFEYLQGNNEHSGIIHPLVMNLTVLNSC